MKYPLALHAALLAMAALAGAAQAHDGGGPLSEGPAGDGQNNLHTTGRAPGAGLPCAVSRIAISSVTPVVVGQVPATSPSGLAFGPNGALFIAEADKIYAVTPNATTPALATVYASFVPGTNGLALDCCGRLGTGDGACRSPGCRGP